MKLSPLEDNLRQLIEIPSVTDDITNNQKVLNFVKQAAQEAGMHINIYNDNGYPILVASSKITKSPQVLLTAHADVVPSPIELFRLRADNKRLYGRGVLDMKFAIASYLELIKLLSKDLHKYNFAIAITSDEETRNLNASYLLSIGYKPKVVILPDGSSDWQIESKAKGAWTTKISVKGIAAHGSRPWEGDSATYKLLDLISELRATFKDQKPNTDTLNISLLEAGEAVNQIPQHASATVDMRVINQEALLSRQKHLDALCKKYGAEYQVLTLLEPFEHDLDNRYFKIFRKIAETETGKSIGTTISQGASEAVSFHLAGIPCIVTCPVGSGRHSPNEWIDRSSLSHYVPILAKFLEAIHKKADKPIRA
jgi:acetylornithine deacetylase/succinyl-diaminopimelate desuccinylase-like protein